MEARIANGRAADSDTLALAEGLVRLSDTLAADSARSFRNLAAIQIERGDFTKALENAERALAAGATAWRSDDPEWADALDVKAKALVSLEKFEEGRTILAQSLAVRNEHRTASPVAVARSLRIAGFLEWNAGNYDKAATLLDRALTTWESAAPNHPDKSWSLADRGYVFFLTGNVAAAEQRWSESLLLATKRLRPDHPAIAHYLRNLGLAQNILGRIPDARRSRERALEIGENSLASCAPELFWLINDNAVSRQTDGDYRDALTLYRRELAMARSCATDESSNTATAIYNMASLAYETGDWTEAERLARQAARVWANRLGPMHPYVARALDQISEALAKRGDFDGAVRLLNRALTVRRKAFGKRHPQIGWNLNEIAEVQMKAGNLAAASKTITEAIEIYRDPSLAGEPDELARALIFRGRVEMQRASFDMARKDFAEALAARRQKYGNQHPLVAEAQASAAAADFALRSEPVPLAPALAAEQVGREHLRFTVRYLPERPAVAYAAARPRGLDLALSIAAVDPTQGASQILDAAIRSRSVILDEFAVRAQMASSNDQELASPTATVVAARQRFATLMFRSLQGESVPAPLLDEAREEKEDAERELAERSVATREEAQRAQTGLEEVRGAMPAGSALVSFLRYDRTSFVNRPSGRTMTTTPSYIALVMRADGDDVHVIPLGTAASLDRLADIFRAEAGGRAIAAAVGPREAERAYRAAGSALRIRVWDPLAESLKGATRVFIVPDGALNLVSFAALPTGNRYLLETGPTIHYLSTERDLVRGTAAQGRGLLALGGPAFDGRGTASTIAAQRSGCGAIGSLRFEDLPGSRAEVLDIARIWGTGNDVLTLSGRAATKAALTRDMVGRRVIHLATHGFFLGSDCGTTVPRTRGVGGIVTAATTTPIDNPLLLSGLALAGVNTLSGARQSNGILNAEEIAGLNLQGTEWAVLSACDTGLGQIAAGEGVFGLRRAFQIAGVHTIIMSLWSVEDQSTRDWMKALYTARLSKQLDTPDSVRAASLQVLEQRRKRNLSTHPFYWAAFVAAGDWR